MGWAYTNLTDESRALVEDFKKQAVITEWQLKRLDPQKPVTGKIYVMPVSEDHKEWLKEQAEKEGIKPKELLEKIISEYKFKKELEEQTADLPADVTKLIDENFEELKL